MPKKHLSVLVAAGFDPNDPNELDKPIDQIVEFARRLDEQAIEQTHNLIAGCQQIVFGARHV